MAQMVEQALKETKLYTDGKDYTLARLPANAITAAAAVIAEIAEPFSALIVDKDEVTLLIPADAWAVFAARLPGHTLGTTAYRLITFDIALELELVGFMAAVSQILAQAYVSILPFAAFTRDHLFVPTGQFDQAWAALHQLKSSK